MGEFVICAAPKEGVDDGEDSLFKQYCSGECTGRMISFRCDPCQSCLCQGYSCRLATSEEIKKARREGMLVR